jgi:hypothetical protein
MSYVQRNIFDSDYEIWKAEYEELAHVLSYKTELKDAIEGKRTKFIEQFVKTVAMMTKG